MSAVGEALAAIRDAIKLADDVKRTGETLKELSKELREQDRRLTRLEARWDTAMELGARSRSANCPTMVDLDQPTPLGKNLPDDRTPR